MQRKIKRSKARKEKLNKTATNLNKTITEYEEKRKQRAIKSQTNNNARVSAESELKKERMTQGKSQWKTFKNSTFWEAVVETPTQKKEERVKSSEHEELQAQF
jgi:hypothetical protein